MEAGKTAERSNLQFMESFLHRAMGDALLSQSVPHVDDGRYRYLKSDESHPKMFLNAGLFLSIAFIRATYSCPYTRGVALWNQDFALFGFL